MAKLNKFCHLVAKFMIVAKFRWQNVVADHILLYLRGLGQLSPWKLFQLSPNNRIFVLNLEFRHFLTKFCFIFGIAVKNISIWYPIFVVFDYPKNRIKREIPKRRHPMSARLKIAAFLCYWIRKIQWWRGLLKNILESSTFYK